METKTNILTPEQSFRQLRQNGSFVIQMAPNNWLVTDFAPESWVYNVYKRTYSYKIFRNMINTDESIQEFCIMGDNSIQELNNFFQNVKPTIFNFVGRPGAGKGTHGGHFAEIYKLPVVKTGELIRASYKESNATITELANKFIDDGINTNSGKSICLDGYPRNFIQKDHLLSYLPNYNIFTVFLNTNEEECLKRISNRHDSHTSDQDQEATERRMEKYGQYTRNAIKSIKEAAYSIRDIYYAEISIVPGAEKDVNFGLMMTGLTKAFKNKISWIAQQQIRNTDLQK